jgi:tRNA(Met) C34 N-acetyltransferase TmcA
VPAPTKTNVRLIFYFCWQDFEALTPNLLARTVETVEGGGIIVVLLRTMTSLKQLYAMTMVSTQSFKKFLLVSFSLMFLLISPVPSRNQMIYEHNIEINGILNARCSTLNNVE